MPNRVNRLLLSEIKQRYEGKEYLIAVGYEGLDITSTNAFRAELASKSMNMTMVKNRIAKIAFKEIGIDGIESILNGQTAFVVGDDPVAMARTIRDFSKEHKEVVFRGAVIENTVLDESSAKGLADAASKEELKSKIVGAAISGGANLSSALLSPAKNIAGCVKSLIEKLEKESA